MRSIPFSELWRDVARRRGMSPSLLSADDKDTLAAFATDALRTAWEHGLWPEWCPVELITPTPEWAEDAAYADGVTVWYSPNGNYYASTGTTTAGQSPETNPELWELVAAPVSLDLRQVFNVYLSDPRDNPRARKTPFVNSPSGIIMPKVDATTLVWVHYRPSSPRLALTAWDVDATYPSGFVVYRETDLGVGESYAALGAVAAGVDPLSTPASWRKQEIPQTLAEYLKAAIPGAWLRAAGQYEQAGRLAAEAEFALVKAYDLATRQTKGLGL